MFQKTNCSVATGIGIFILNAGLFAIGANLLVIVVIYRKKSMRTPSDLLILNLRLTDFLDGFVLQPLFVVCICMTC